MTLPAKPASIDPPNPPSSTLQTGAVPMSTSAEAGPSKASAGPIRPQAPTTTAAAGTTTVQQSRKRLDAHDPSLEPMSEVMLRRVTRIKEGDNVLLKLPSDSVKAVVASKEGLVQLGKFGAFPSHLLLGLHYDITYEIYPDPQGGPVRSTAASTDRGGSSTAFGQARGKKSKKGKTKEGDDEEDSAAAGATGIKGGKKGAGDVRSNPGWNNLLRPQKRENIVEAVVEDITETNEFIDDTDTGQDLLTQEEIAELRAQGATVEDMMKAQIARHERFGLKTDFSKEKWRKRKEKKYSQTIHPISPSAHNMTKHNFIRSPASILYLREDTLSQLLTLSNVRPGGRYLVVDGTSGLITAALMERMGCDGRVLSFNDADSPPPWGVLNTMNFSERELACVKWLNWMEAEERYERPPPPAETDMPAVAEIKTTQRLKRHMFQVKELNSTRNELHTGNWDGLILATELNPISILTRLTPYLAGSSTLTVYSPHLQILGETLQYCRYNPSYLNANLTESWSRTYQVLPGRTHPLMSTSATGGYLLHATKVFVGHFETDSSLFKKRRQDGSRKTKGASADPKVNGSAEKRAKTDSGEPGARAGAAQSAAMSVDATGEAAAEDDDLFDENASDFEEVGADE